MAREYRVSLRYLTRGASFRGVDVALRVDDSIQVPGVSVDCCHVLRCYCVLGGLLLILRPVLMLRGLVLCTKAVI